MNIAVAAWLWTDSPLAGVRLDDRESSLVREGGLYVARMAGRGVHTLTVRFHVGEEQERFTRRVRVALPADGATAFALTLPETDIDPRAAAVSRRQSRAGAAGRFTKTHPDSIL